MTPAAATISARDLIRDRLRLAVVPSVPEIRLYTAHAGSGLSALGPAAAPYWAFPWAGGITLARYILDRPEVVAGRRVLDLGSGSGLVAIAARLAGARSVIAADIDRFAAAAVALNAAENGVDVLPVEKDFTRGARTPEVELILAGDVFYDNEVAKRMTRLLDRCRAAHVDVLVGDPWRPALPRTRLRELAAYRMRDVGDGETAARAAAVFAYLPSAPEEAGEEALLLRRRGRRL